MPIDWQDQAEFNLEQDIGGVEVLFDSGVPLVLVPCEGVTSTLPNADGLMEGSRVVGNRVGHHAAYAKY